MQRSQRIRSRRAFCRRITRAFRKYQRGELRQCQHLVRLGLVVFVYVERCHVEVEICDDVKRVQTPTYTPNPANKCPLPHCKIEAEHARKLPQNIHRIYDRRNLWRYASRPRTNNRRELGFALLSLWVSQTLEKGPKQPASIRNNRYTASINFREITRDFGDGSCLGWQLGSHQLFLVRVQVPQQCSTGGAFCLPTASSLWQLGEPIPMSPLQGRGILSTRPS